jgi:protein MpaA
MARYQRTVGHTVLGRPIEVLIFEPPDYAQPRPPALIFGAIHGDEAVTQLMCERLADELVERPPGRLTWIIPCVNVDGVLAGTRNNANDVDLNRNFACPSWGEQRRPGYNPGGAAEDQPESQALVKVIDELAPQRIIALHAGYRMVNYDGTGEALAREMSARCGYPVEHDMGYPTPGSFGTKYGVHANLEVITVETPYLMVDEAAWGGCRTALRWCVDLPD